MCTAVRLQAVDDDGLMTSTTSITTSYSTFSIASLIGHDQVSDDEATLSRITERETTVKDHPASDSATSLHAAAAAADDDDDDNDVTGAGGSHCHTVTHSLM